MTSIDLSEIRVHLGVLPSELIDELLDEFGDMRRRFLLRDWGPGELKGGRFAEATMRVLEWMMVGKYTALGDQLNRTGIVKRVENDTSLPDGHRFHVRRAADLLLDVRNKRAVAHLGSDVDVNRMDAELVLRLCSWILAEMVREFGQADPDAAQTLIDKITAEQLPWIEEVDGDLLVLAMELSAADRTLLALHHAQPNSMPIGDLREMVGYKNSSEFKTKVLAGLAKNRRIHLKNGAASITSNGIGEIETTIVDLRSG